MIASRHLADERRTFQLMSSSSLYSSSSSLQNNKHANQFVSQHLHLLHIILTVSDCLMTLCLSKDGVRFDHTLFLCLQITGLDIRPYIMWAVSLVIADSNITFLWGFVGMYGLTYSFNTHLLPSRILWHSLLSLLTPYLSWNRAQNRKSIFFTTIKSVAFGQ